MLLESFLTLLLFLFWLWVGLLFFQGKKTNSVIYPKYYCWAFALLTLFACLLVDVFSVSYGPSTSLPTTQSGPSDILTFYVWVSK